MSSTTYPLGGSAEEHAAALLSADDLANRLRDTAPDMGCYLIEAHTREPDYQEAFWGDHYGRLVNIKKQKGGLILQTSFGAPYSMCS